MIQLMEGSKNLDTVELRTCQFYSLKMQGREYLPWNIQLSKPNVDAGIIVPCTAEFDILRLSRIPKPEFRSFVKTANNVVKVIDITGLSKVFWRFMKKFYSGDAVKRLPFKKLRACMVTKTEPWK